MKDQQTVQQLGALAKRILLGHEFEPLLQSDPLKFKIHTDFGHFWTDSPGISKIIPILVNCGPIPGHPSSSKVGSEALADDDILAAYRNPRKPTEG